MHSKNQDLKDWRNALRQEAQSIFARIGADIDYIYGDVAFRKEQGERSSTEITLIGEHGNVTTILSALDPERPSLRHQYAVALNVSNDKANNLNFIDKVLESWSGNILINCEDIYESDDPEVISDLMDALNKATKSAHYHSEMQDYTQTANSAFVPRSPQYKKLVHAEILLKQLDAVIKSDLNEKFTTCHRIGSSPWLILREDAITDNNKPDANTSYHLPSPWISI